MTPEEKKPSILISGLVAARDGQPYIQMDVDGHGCQLSMSEARQIAQDLTTMCARTEADAMIVKFFSKSQFPEQAAGALLMDFRDFRQALDLEKAERSE